MAGSAGRIKREEYALAAIAIANQSLDRSAKVQFENPNRSLSLKNSR
jgi:hypothetical protein